MADLSNTDIIAQYPLGRQLDGFVDALRSKYNELGLSGLEDSRSRIARLVESSGMKSKASRYSPY